MPGEHILPPIVAMFFTKGVPMVSAASKKAFGSLLFPKSKIWEIVTAEPNSTKCSCILIF